MALCYESGPLIEPPQLMTIYLVADQGLHAFDYLLTVTGEYLARVEICQMSKFMLNKHLDSRCDISIYGEAIEGREIKCIPMLPPEGPYALYRIIGYPYLGIHLVPRDI